MTESAGVRVWIAAGALALFAFALGAARAQQEAPASEPATDVFANSSSGTTVYQDQFSSNCDETNHSSLAMDSPDPAVCFDSPAAANGECSPIGGKDSTPAGQTGNICHYCQKAAMPGKEIIIPSSGGIGFGTPSYDWICTANPSDGCYMSCFGNLPTPTLPPGSSVQQETGQNGHPIFKITISNDPQPQTSAQPTPDPCYPAGPKNYNACDYPNVARPAGCECSKTPGPQPATQPSPTPQPGPINPAALDQAMNACLKKVVPYWTDATVDPDARSMALTEYAPSAQSTPYSPIFEEAMGMALIALQEHDREYGIKGVPVQLSSTSSLGELNGPSASSTSGLDYMDGWFYNCVQDANLVPTIKNNEPNDPGDLYAQYLGVTVGVNSPRISDFLSGYGGGPRIVPFSLLPPGQKSFSSVPTSPPAAKP